MGGIGCVVVDPAYFPTELLSIADCASAHGGAQAVVFTHGHWDHIMGHTALPAAPVLMSANLAQAITSGDRRASEYLQEAHDFDSRWYVPRPAGHAWPVNRQPLFDDDVIEIAGLRIAVLQLTGHSPDGLGLVVDGTLLVGDHLSPCEIPFVDDAVAYVATLRRLDLLMRSDVHCVVPGHGSMLTVSDARRISQEDQAYLAQLLDAAAAHDVARGLAIELPRAAAVVGMRDQHAKNCARLGLVAG